MVFRVEPRTRALVQRSPRARESDWGKVEEVKRRICFMMLEE